MRAWVFLFIFLIGCEQALQTIPTSDLSSQQEVTQETDPCALILCKPTEVCKGGSCVCPTDTKRCGDACVSELNCCSDSDCGKGYCVQGNCITDCQYGQVFEDGECQCAPDRKLCEEQGKCIAKTSCCIHSQCDRNERCVPTSFRTRLCFEADGKKICRLLVDNERSEFIEIANHNFEAQIATFFSDKSVNFVIGNQTLKLAAQTPTDLLGVTIFHEGVDEVGGFCKADEEE